VIKGHTLLGNDIAQTNLGHFLVNVICDSIVAKQWKQLDPNVIQQRVPVGRPVQLLRKTRLTDGLIRCSLPTPEREEQIKVMKIILT
jgi:hypothetical protein